MGSPCCCLTVTLAVCAVVGVNAAETRDDSVLYLSEWKQPPLQLKALRRTPMCFSPNESRDVAYLSKGQPVNVIGLGETMDYVEAQTVTGPVRGWVKTAALEPAPSGLLGTLHKRREQTIARRELIARHEVVLGMTTEEVRESLGKPDRKLGVRLPDGQQVQWAYETYRYVPTYHSVADEKGMTQRVVSYTRTVAGCRVIAFRGDAVIAISDQAGNEPRLPPAARPPTPSAGN